MPLMLSSARALRAHEALTLTRRYSAGPMT
nr:MAG TPA: hypothetical protein [Caudoviricetes sp.]